MSTQCCGTCTWSRDHGAVVECQFPLPEWLLRDAFNPLTGGGPLANYLAPDAGVHCHTYEAKL